jgi:hypothetical protein
VISPQRSAAIARGEVLLEALAILNRERAHQLVDDALSRPLARHGVVSHSESKIDLSSLTARWTRTRTVPSLIPSRLARSA